jgi:hypothetical protein
MKFQSLLIALTTSIFAISTNTSWSLAAGSTRSTLNVSKQNPATLIAKMSYGTNRRPITCPSRVSPQKGAPSLAQAKAYFICDKETLFGDFGTDLSSFLFVNDLNMQISSKARAATGTDLALGYKQSIDTNRPVYPIRGTYTIYLCFADYPGSHRKGKNCKVSVENESGVCFHSSFGDWHCRMRNISSENKGQSAPPQ